MYGFCLYIHVWMCGNTLKDAIQIKSVSFQLIKSMKVVIGIYVSSKYLNDINMTSVRKLCFSNSQLTPYKHTRSLKATRWKVSYYAPLS